MKTFFFLFLLFTVLISSEPTLDEIQNIQLEDIKKIPGWINDKKTKPRLKVIILEKLNILLLNHPDVITNQSSLLFELLRDVNKKNKDDTSSYNYLLRKKSCLLLSYFNNSQKERESYEIIRSQILAENNGEVAATCIQVLSLFEERKDETNKFLNKILESSMEKKKLSEDDSEIAMAIIDIFEKFKKKQSYLVLLKILESKYPTDVKNKAKKTLEIIPQ